MFGNSLFYDPFACKIYDYANGLADLKSMKVIFYWFTTESFLPSNVIGITLECNNAFSMDPAANHDPCSTIFQGRSW